MEVKKLLCRKERFEQVTKEVHRLPMEEYVSREELQQCTLHQLRVRLPLCICQRLVAGCLRAASPGEKEFAMTF